MRWREARRVPGGRDRGAHVLIAAAADGNVRRYGSAAVSASMGRRCAVGAVLLGRRDWHGGARGRCGAVFADSIGGGRDDGAGSAATLCAGWRFVRRAGAGGALSSPVSSPPVSSRGGGALSGSLPGSAFSGRGCGSASGDVARASGTASAPAYSGATHPQHTAITMNEHVAASDQPTMAAARTMSSVVPQSVTDVDSCRRCGATAAAEATIGASAASPTRTARIDSGQKLAGCRARRKARNDVMMQRYSSQSDPNVRVGTRYLPAVL